MFHIKSTGWYGKLHSLVLNCKGGNLSDSTIAHLILKQTFELIPCTMLATSDEYADAYVRHTITFFCPDEAPFWLKNVVVGIRTENFDMSRVIKQSIEYAFPWNDAVQERCNYANAFTLQREVNRKIQVTSFKRPVDDDDNRVIQRGQLGIYLFSTLQGDKMFFIHGERGQYNGEFLDSKDSVQFAYL